MIIIICSFSNAIADTTTNVTSLISYDATACFLCCYDHTTDSFYYCINKQSILFPGIDYANLYHAVENESHLLFRSNKYVSSVFFHNETIYYVAFDSFSNRGALYASDIQTSKTIMVLSEYYGVGQILGCNDQLLYIETENYICTIDLLTTEIRQICSKDFYASHSTRNGITFFHDNGWYYLPWTAEEPILLFNSESPTVTHCSVVALSQNCYVLLNRTEKQCCIILDHEKVQIENVISVGISDNLIVLCCTDNNIKIYSTENHITLLQEFPSDLTGQLYVIDDAIVMLGKQNMLCIYDVPNE